METWLCCDCSGRLMALNAIRCGAQNSAAIGDTADITGLEAASGSIENDPLRKSGGPKCCDAQRGISSSGVVACNPRTEGRHR
jgi:hypothetical protein